MRQAAGVQLMNGAHYHQVEVYSVVMIQKEKLEDSGLLIYKSFLETHFHTMPIENMYDKKFQMTLVKLERQTIRRNSAKRVTSLLEKKQHRPAPN